LDGEAEISAVMAIRAARKQGLDLKAFAAACCADVPETTPETTKGAEPPPGCSIIVQFGKYRGQSLAWIARHDFSYLTWMSENLKKTLTCGTWPDRSWSSSRRESTNDRD
jgi:hypothetical protein